MIWVQSVCKGSQQTVKVTASKEKVDSLTDLYYISDPFPDPDTKASSPASFDLSDPEEFHKKLIDILNEPTETSKEQLKKLMAEMEAKSKTV